MRPSYRTHQRDTWADVLERVIELRDSYPEGNPKRARYEARIAECREHMRGRKVNGQFDKKGLLTIGDRL